MTLGDYRRRLSWTQRELAKRTNLDYNTVRKAESGETVSARTALAIAEALSKALGERVLIEDIDGLNVAL